jgi:hypothetical protein
MIPRGVLVRPLAVAAIIWFVGCGKPATDRQELEGTITYNGKPVPYGAIRFEPVDPASGWEGSATIQKGRYKTNPGCGPKPGRYVAWVDGFQDKPGSDISEQPLFIGARVEVEVPAGAREVNLDVAVK